MFDGTSVDGSIKDMWGTFRSPQDNTIADDTGMNLGNKVISYDWVTESFTMSATRPKTGAGPLDSVIACDTTNNWAWVITHPWEGSMSSDEGFMEVTANNVCHITNIVSYPTIDEDYTHDDSTAA